ncbi:TonB-dependent receptor [Candidatus Albibeggiatoa sp. nov. NOAA]|uniref:TonB-dependent receptor plug domain-containing protein n=1 Tax=Candidatus Albibeggiatoa sp. nov. NOAA TaxID=3162724 RepID=UPI0032FC8600|nr:TonB-dependent receptor [Thiotrichaceae bacterium]
MKKIKSYLHLIPLSFFLSIYPSYVLNAFELDAAFATQELLQLSLEELMDLQVITASKKQDSIHDAPGIITVVTAQEIEKFGANNLREVLGRLTSTYLSQMYIVPQNSTAVRGSFGGLDTQVLLLLNGRPFKESISGGFNYPIYLAFPISSIQKIEMIRGPGSVLYGSNAYMGVINILTKTDENTNEISVMTGSLGTRATETYVHHEHNDLKLTTGLRYFEETEGWQFQAVDELGESNQTQFDEYNAGAYFNANYKQFNVDFTWLRANQRHFGEIPQWSWQAQDIKTTRILADIGYKHHFSDHWHVETNLTYNQRQTDLESGVNRKNQENKDWLLEIVNYWQNDKFSWLMGATAQYMTGASLATTKDVPERLYPTVRNYYETLYTLYTQADYKFNEKTKFILGGQWVQPEGISSSFVPRLGLIYQFSDNLGVKILYSEAYRTAFEVEKSIQTVVVQGTKDLKPETIKTYDFQVFYDTQHHQFSATYYRSTQQDLITAIPMPNQVRLRYTNLGEREIQGIELESKWMPSEKIFFTSSLTYQSNENNQGLKNVTLMPNWMVKLGISYQFNHAVALSLFDTYYTAAHINPLRPKPKMVNPPANNYHMVTLNMRVKLDQWLNLPSDNALILNTYIYNLLDEEVYMPEFLRGQINSLPVRQGRGIYVGLKYYF